MTDNVVPKPSSSSQNWLIPMVFALILGAISGAMAHTFQGRFRPPTGLSSQWEIVSPYRMAIFDNPQIGRGVYISDGSLNLIAHPLTASDNLLFRTDQPVAGFEITLLEDSEQLMVSLDSGTRHVVQFSPGIVLGFPHGGQQTPVNTNTFKLSAEEGKMAIEAGGKLISLPTFQPGAFEMSTMGAYSRIASLKLYDKQGNLLLDEDYRTRGQSPYISLGVLLVGVLLGALWGALVQRRQQLQRLFMGSLLCAPPSLICAISPVQWLNLSETMYLTQTPNHVLANGCLFVSLLPLCAWLVLNWGWLSLEKLGRRGKVETDQFAFLLWAMSGIGCVVYSAPDSPSSILVGAIPLVAYLGIPLLLMRRARFRQGRWLWLDIPSFLCIGLWGWGLGIALSLVWRWLLFLASFRVFRRWAVRPTADHLFILLLAIPVATELGLRDSYLGDGWNSQVLGMDIHSTFDEGRAVLSWKDGCGSVEPQERIHIAFSGGSSTGGAYQFKDNPEYFFSAQIHNKLCSAMTPQQRLVTSNFGAADQNTFHISRSLNDLIEQAQPDLLVLYIGVNDLLSQRFSKTRRQRETDRVNQTKAYLGLSHLLGRSRLITGLSLPFQSVSNTEKVSEVPVEDAAVFLGDIANELEASGTKLLLVTELVHSDEAHKMQSYQDMQQQIAEDKAHVSVVNLGLRFGTEEINQMLVDRNHMSAEGNAKVAESLMPAVRQALGITSME